MCHRPVGPGEGEGECARVRRVSALTQIRLKNWQGMGRPRTKSGRASVWLGALGRFLCPCRPKRTAADEMGRPIEIALTRYTCKPVIALWSTIHAQPCVLKRKQENQCNAFATHVLERCHVLPSIAKTRTAIYEQDAAGPLFHIGCRCTVIFRVPVCYL